MKSIEMYCFVAQSSTVLSMAFRSHSIHLLIVRVYTSLSSFHQQRKFTSFYICHLDYPEPLATDQMPHIPRVLRHSPGTFTLAYQALSLNSHRILTRKPYNKQYMDDSTTTNSIPPLM